MALPVIATTSFKTRSRALLLPQYSRLATVINAPP
uniref:Uncharacterized protein n=1 Tax=Anguilla anguilla TaxID=7936 RepID=A0A0E9QF21_ANGAN